MKIIKILVMVLFMFTFFSCSNENVHKTEKSNADSLKKPKNFESIQQKEWEEHRKDTLQNNKNSDTTIIKYKKTL